MEHQHTTHESPVKETKNPQPKQENFFVEILRFTIIALLIVVPIRLFIAQPFIVSGASMAPTFQNGQYLIVDQLTYHLEVPKRGDVIIFRYPNDPSKFFIKRIIGLPGDTLEIFDNRIIIRNAQNTRGVALDEPYLHDVHMEDMPQRSLKAHEYFVMGDNRDASSDSRIWGVLEEDLIVGRAFVRLFPVTNADILPGSHTFLFSTSTNLDTTRTGS